jgi:hypothetical protein
VDPHLDQIIGLLDGLRLGNKETLENVSQVTHIEFVMEVDGSLPEILFDFTVEGESGLNDGDDLLLDSTLEFREVLAHKGVVDSEQGGLLREGNSKCPEMSLQTRINLEGTSCWVHASCVQGILNILESELGPIIPMIVVLMLSQK